jgi:6-phosphogluconolactonase
MNLRIFESYEDLSHAAARALRQSGAKKIALTGGSTPKRMYEILGESVPQDVQWVLLDERYVPFDDPQSNAAMIERTLFRGAPPERWLKFDTSLNDPALTARRFEEQWDFGDLDLVLLGCGEDGHTASLFPGTPVLDVADRIASEVYAPRLEQWRVTLTMPVIRAAKQRLVLANGPSKMEVVERVRAGEDLPIARATQDLDTWWMVSRSAAAEPPLW